MNFPFDGSLEANHKYMVHKLVKSPREILRSLDPLAVNMWHAGTGIATEAGELLTSIKKSVIYNQLPDIENMIEELGDLEFYMEQLRQVLGVTRERCLKVNMEKLSRRYPEYNYSDKNASERKDKVNENP